MHQSMVLNAAIEELVSENDPNAESAREIIEYGAKLQVAGSTELTASWRGKNKDSFRGTTNELGDVHISDDKEEEKEIGLKIKKERIGLYRIWKSAEGHLQFHHYWASNETTRTDSSPHITTYHLFYDTNTLREIGFAKEYIYSEKVYRFFKFRLIHKSLRLRLIFGSVPSRYKKRVLNQKS